jgi:hypothetical protein
MAKLEWGKGGGTGKLPDTTSSEIDSVLKSDTPSTVDFQVVIRGVTVPADAAKRIEASIRRVVLQEIAQIDLRGKGARLHVPDTFPESRARIPGGTMGIVVDFPEPKPMWPNPRPRIPTRDDRNS